MSNPYAGVTHGATNRSLQLDQVLDTLLRQAPDIEAAAVVSFDGLPMASALPPSMDEDRVAAMSAALLSLGERAAQGLGRGDLSQVYVEGDNGTVFLVSADDEAVLVAVGRHGAKVGLMLFEVKQAAAAVAHCLRIDDQPMAGPPLVAVAPVEHVTPVEHVAPADPVAPPVPQATPVQVAPAPAVEHPPVESPPVEAPPMHQAPTPIPVAAVPFVPVSVAPTPLVSAVEMQSDATQPASEPDYPAVGVVAHSNGWNGTTPDDEYQAPTTESGTWT